ncbi:MAG: hypothetical protein J3K34DRAFT_111877 [Monoraphidium minutum]|nr:MAG: hypothetical protein J3K34DRAFT_111877 [Monoraphidium minutum]
MAVMLWHKVATYLTCLVSPDPALSRTPQALALSSPGSPPCRGARHRPCSPWCARPGWEVPFRRAISTISQAACAGKQGRAAIGCGQGRVCGQARAGEVVADVQEPDECNS